MKIWDWIDLGFGVMWGCMFVAFLFFGYTPSSLLTGCALLLSALYNISDMVKNK